MINRLRLFNKATTSAVGMETWSCLDRTVSAAPLVLGMLFLVLTQAVFAASGDEDAGGSGTDAYERSQRLELLRSHTPSAPSSSNSTSRGRYLDPDPGYRVQPAVPTKSRRAPIETETERPRYTAPRYKAPSQLRTVSDEGETKVVHRPAPRKTASHKTKNKIKAGSRAKKSAAVETPVKTPKSAGTAPRCGFCLVDGYVFCSGQSVSLRQLVEQDRRQRGTKHPHKKKKRGTQRHSSAKGPKIQKKAASVRAKKTRQRR